MESFILLFIIFIIIGIAKMIFSYKRKITKLINELDESKRNERHLDSVLKMTSFHIRSYKEGTNPYTVMSKIIDLYRDEL